MKGLGLWNKHMPSKLWINYENSMMMQVLRIRGMGLVSGGSNNVFKL